MSIYKRGETPQAGTLIVPHAILTGRGWRNQGVLLVLKILYPLLS